MHRFAINHRVGAGVLLALLAAPAPAQTPAPFESAPGPAPAARPAPHPRPPAAEPQPQTPPQQVVAPARNLPGLDAAYAARVQQVAQAAGTGMDGNLNFRRDTTPPKWQAFLGAWGPGDRMKDGSPIGQQNIFVIEAINAGGFADIVMCWNDGARWQRGWHRTIGVVSGDTIVIEENTKDGHVRDEIALSSDGNLHVKFQFPSTAIQVVAPRVK
jgi:hypothetical protein